jgi:hypothetical protein
MKAYSYLEEIGRKYNLLLDHDLYCKLEATHKNTLWCNIRSKKERKRLKIL